MDRDFDKPVSTVPESTKDILKEFGERRLQIWQGIVSRLADNPGLKRNLSLLANLTVAAYPKMAVEAWQGRTADGRELTNMGRIINTFVSGTGLGKFVLAATGQIPAAAVSYGASIVGWSIMYTPDIILPVLDKLEQSMANDTQTDEKLVGVVRVVTNSVRQYQNIWFKPGQ